MEVTQEQTGHDPAAGFGANGKPDLWIGGEGGLDKPLHVAIVAKDRATVDAFYKAALAAGGHDNGAPIGGRIWGGRAVWSPCWQFFRGLARQLLRLW
jgi:hypothetical protein